MPHRIAAELLYWLAVALLAVECLAQFVFHRQDIVNAACIAALGALAVRYPLLPTVADSDETAPGGEQQ